MTSYADRFYFLGYPTQDGTEKGGMFGLELCFAMAAQPSDPEGAWEFLRFVMHRNEQETEGLAPLTRQIEGVEVGITIREKPDGTCKASLRTFESVNAAEIAKAFGGGGHPQAAACNLDMDVKTARAKLVEKCGELLV